MVCRGTLIYLPPNERDKVFHEIHNSPIGGHSGISKSLLRLKQRYYYENMKRDVQKRILQCLDCQLKKLRRIRTKMPMIITNTEPEIFSQVSMDCVGPVKESKDNYKYMLTIQDNLSKFVVVVPLKSIDTETVADAFIKRFICLYGSPKRVLTDRGSCFISGLMKAIAKRFKITQDMTSSYHPQGNFCEKYHFKLSEYLRTFAEKTEDWSDWCELAALNYNSTVHSGTNFTPYEILYGKLINLPSE